MKKLRIFKNTSGMTLVELIAAMVMMVLLTVALTAVIGPTLEDYARTKEFADVSNVVNNVGDRIMSELAMSRDDNAVTVDTDGSGVTVKSCGGSVKLSFENGMLMQNGVPVYDAAYYKNNILTAAFSFDKTTGLFSVNLKVTGRRNNKEMYSIDRTFYVRPIINS